MLRLYVRFMRIVIPRPSELIMSGDNETWFRYVGCDPFAPIGIVARVNAQQRQQLEDINNSNANTGQKYVMAQRTIVPKLTHKQFVELYSMFREYCRRG